MSDTKPSVGQALVSAWLGSLSDRPAPSMGDCLDLVERIDAKINLYTQHAWASGARLMRDECASVLRRCNLPAESEIVAYEPLPLPPRATPLVADAGAQPTDAAIERARREGAQAMREACAAAASNQRAACPYPSRDYSEGWRDAAGKIERDIGALPLPGDAP